MDKNILYDGIAKVAYDIYERRGMVHGYDFEDWLEAENIMLERHAKEMEQEAEVIRSTKRKKMSGKTKPKTQKSSQKTSDRT